jgi:hypothetical protein
MTTLKAPAPCNGIGLELPSNRRLAGITDKYWLTALILTRLCLTATFRHLENNLTASGGFSRRSELQARRCAFAGTTTRLSAGAKKFCCWTAGPKVT